MKKIDLWREGKKILEKYGYINPQQKARFFLEYLCRQRCGEFFRSLEEDIDGSRREDYFALLQRFISGEPAGYIFQETEFMNLPFYVDQRVLDPRPETELLVEAVIEHCNSVPVSFPRIMDIGTGSGCIIISLANYLGEGFFLGTDISFEALQVAQKNYRVLLKGKKVHFLNNTFCRGIKQGAEFDIIVTNPPYADIGDCRVEKGVREYEPAIAVFSENRGRRHIEKILDESRFLLGKDGLLFMEIGYNQFDWIVQLAREMNYFPARSIKDYQGINRHVIFALSD